MLFSACMMADFVVVVVVTVVPYIGTHTHQNIFSSTRVKDYFWTKITHTHTHTHTHTQNVM